VRPVGASPDWTPKKNNSTPKPSPNKKEE
jgi:hypothetical protein